MTSYQKKGKQAGDEKITMIIDNNGQVRIIGIFFRAINMAASARSSIIRRSTRPSIMAKKGRFP